MFWMVSNFLVSTICEVVFVLMSAISQAGAGLVSAVSQVFSMVSNFLVSKSSEVVFVLTSAITQAAIG